MLLLLLPLALALPLQQEGDTAESSDPEFVLGASCTAEGLTPEGEYDQGKIAECGECWENLGQGTEARECVARFLPNIGVACRELLEVEEEDQAEILRCFYDYVLSLDKAEEVRQGVRQFLELTDTDEEEEEEVDSEYVIGTSCTLEARGEDGSFDEARIGDCSACWERVGEVLTETGLPAARACVQQFTPSMGAACSHQLAELEVGDYRRGKAVFACFLDFVRETDVDGEVQAGVAKYLRESVETEYVLGTSCTIEARREDGSFDETSIEECGRCWEEAGAELLSQEGLVKAKQCAVVHLPKIQEACSEDIENLLPEDTEQGRKVFRCFYDYVLDHDLEEVVQTGVREYLERQDDQGRV